MKEFWLKEFMEDFQKGLAKNENEKWEKTANKTPEGLIDLANRISKLEENLVKMSQSLSNTSSKVAKLAELQAKLEEQMLGLLHKIENHDHEPDLEEELYQ